MMKQDQLKILLIEPPFYRLFKDTYSLDRYPLSLGYLAGTIKKETNWNVMAYNSDFSSQTQSESIKVSYLAGAGFDNYLNNLREPSGQLWREIKSTIAEYKPTVIGISAKSQNFASAHIVAKFAKEINKQMIVVMGGPHPSIVGSDLLNYPEIDICVRGEGENTIVELLDAIENGKNFDGIQGITYKKDGRIIENPHRKLIKDLDSLCFPHESAPEALKDYDHYPLTAFQSIFAIRGCPYNCLFCGSHKIWSRKVRFRSPENVIEEIKGLQKKGLTSVHFDDDTFGVNKHYINDLCNALIAHCPELAWSCEMHVKLVNEQTISLMKTAGCCLIQIGIESGNNEILKKIKKNITIEEALSACEIIKKHGIALQTFFMVGFPQETEDTLNDTMAAMKKIKANLLIYSIFTPYPGTEMFEFCKEKGLIDDDYNVSLYYHQSPKNCFCIDITPEKFRMLASKIEEMVDRVVIIGDYLQRANVYSQQGKFREAEEELKNALSLEPEDKNSMLFIYYAIASNYERMGQLDKAKEKFEEVIKIAKEIPASLDKNRFASGAHFHLGQTYQEMRKEDKAKLEYEECLKLNPEHKKAREHLLYLVDTDPQK